MMAWLTPDQLSQKTWVEIPKTMSVAGIDDISINNTSWPRLTTIALALHAFAEEGMALLLPLLDRKPVKERTVVGKLIQGDPLGPSPERGFRSKYG